MNNYWLNQKMIWVRDADDIIWMKVPTSSLSGPIEDYITLEKHEELLAKQEICQKVSENGGYLPK